MNLDGLLARATSSSRIEGIGSAFPASSYTQEQIRELLGISNSVVLRLLRAPHIRKRHLYLPRPDPATGEISEESAAELHEKFGRGIRDIGVKAVNNALGDAKLVPGDIDYMVCVTSTGLKMPGISSIISREVGGFSRYLHHSDIVGMGCNAGLNALCTASQWSRANVGENGLVLCCEINSASYVKDDTVETGIVNSLFGDGSSAIVVRTPDGSSSDSAGTARPVLLDFCSYNLPEHHGEMRFDWDDKKGRLSFYVGRDVPKVIGGNVSIPVGELLRRNGLSKADINHWAIHTGGNAVIENVRQGLGLTAYDVRHTTSVLRDYGNISSASYLVSLERLKEEGEARPNDLGVFIAMGPGALIESALAIWG